MARAFAKIIQTLVPLKYEPAGFNTDALIAALVFGFFGMMISVWASSSFSSTFYSELRAFDIWFQADQPRVFGAMIDSESYYHYRTSVHPLFSLLTSPLAQAIIELGASPVSAGRILLAISAFAAVALLLLALTGLGLPIAPAACFTAVFLASATFIHWFSIIETYAFAAVSISLMLMVLTGVNADRQWIWLLASIGTLAITTTNWSLAIASSIFRLDRKTATSMIVLTFFIVAILALVQQKLYPHAWLFFVPSAVSNEWEWTQLSSDWSAGKEGWTPFRNLWSLLVTSAITPAPEVTIDYTKTIISNQHAKLSSYNFAGGIALVSWLFMLVGGIICGWKNLERRAVFAALCLFLIGQCALHSIYGSVTFLYGAHFFPALIVLAAFSWHSSSLRFPAIVATVTFVVFGSISNLDQFGSATNLVNILLSE